MPRFKAFCGSNGYTIETERPISHLLTGCRIEAFERPPQDLFERFSRSKAAGPKAAPEDRLTLPELDRLAKYERNLRTGRYTRKPLDWFESEQGAINAQADWPTHEDFRVIPVSARLE